MGPGATSFCLDPILSSLVVETAGLFDGLEELRRRGGTYVYIFGILVDVACCLVSI